LLPEQDVSAEASSFSWQGTSRLRPGHFRADFVCSKNGQRKLLCLPGKRSGKPCVRGMRITVADVLGYLASGMSFEEILEDFPFLEKEDILACLSYAANKEYTKKDNSPSS